MVVRKIKGFEQDGFTELIQQFADEASEPTDIDFCKARWTSLEEAGTAYSYGAFDGHNKLIGIVGFVVSEGFNVPGAYAFESFWYVQKDSRKTTAGGRLFKALEEAAAELGCIGIYFAHYDHLESKHIEKFITSRGYKIKEHIYRKVLP